MSSIEKKLSDQSLARLPCYIRETVKAFLHLPPDSIITFAGGLPNSKLYPFKSLSVELIDGSEMKVSPETMASVLQYGPSDGFPPLVKLLTNFQRRLHATPDNFISKGAWGVLPVSGAMDGISKVFDMFLNEGDSFLSEIPVYAGVLAVYHLYKAHVLCCESDGDGLIPEVIRNKIEAARKKGWPLPKFLYTCATANNPAGASTTAQRRREIYSLACLYDFYIIDDDPYYFVQFETDNPAPSYLSLDTEGRVIRIDSFSKVFSAGLRLGYVTAPTAILQRLILHLQNTQMHPSGVAQALVFQLFEHWSDEKMFEHFRNVANFYHQQMVAMVALIEKHLKGLVEYTVPTGGMFLWLRLPSVRDTKALVLRLAESKKVLFVPGIAFYPNFADADQTPSEKHHQYIRASFSLATPEQMDEGLKRLRQAIEEEVATERR